jgi:hypothetical protein
LFRALALGACLAAAHANALQADQPWPPPRIDVALAAVDDAGKPIPGATARVMYAMLLHPPYGPQQMVNLTTTAGDDGILHFGSLQTERQISVAVAAPGFVASPVHMVLGHEVPPKVTLQRRDPAHPPENAIIGRVVSPAGRPVAGAFLLVTRVMRTKNSWTNGADTTDAAVITDDNGRFALVTDPKSPGTWLQILHKDQPPCQLRNLLPSKDEQTLAIPAPVTVRGRLLHNNQPTPNIELALTEGEIGQSGPALMHATTNDKGEFTFPLVPPDQKWLLFATLNAARQTSIEPRELAAAPAGQTIDAGDIDLIPTITLAGHIKAEGMTNPPPSTIILQRFRTTEVLEVQAAPDGAFEFKNLPRGSYTTFVVNQDLSWRLSPKNRSYPWDNAMFLQGALTDDKPDLAILITQEKAPALQQRAENMPIRGIEK